MEYKYKAFISYAHKARDIAAAEALQTAIERYVIPAKLRNNGVKQIGRIFRDEAEMHANSDLTHKLHEALEDSEYLIVICSRDAAASEWVSHEVAYFREHRDEKNILTVLTGGDPKVLFPVVMPDMPEPLYIDLSAGNTKEMLQTLKDRFLKLCAPLVGCDYDDLVMRDQKRKRSQMAWWIAGIAAVASVIIGILSWSNWRIERKNEELERQNNEILLRESELLTQEALEALDQNDRLRAVECLVSALPSPGNERPYYAPAEQALFSSLDLFNCTFDFPAFLSNTTLQQTTPIDNFCINKSGARLATIDNFGTVTCYNSTTGEIIWQTEFEDNDFSSNQIWNCSINNTILICFSGTIISLHWDDGEAIWVQYSDLFDPQFFILSPDEQTLAIRQMSPYDFDYATDSIVFLSTIDGTFLNCVNIENDVIKGSAVSHGSFSQNGSKFCGIAQEYIPGSQYQNLHFFTIDVASGIMDLNYSSSVSIDCTLTDMGIAFCDNDTALVAMIAKPDSTEPFLCTKIDLYDGNILWETYVDMADHVDPFSSTTEFLTLFFDNTILLFKNTELFMLDLYSGNQLPVYQIENDFPLMSCEFYKPIVTAEKIDSSSFAYITQDGYYSIGYIHSGSFDTSYKHGYLHQLGETYQAKLWNGGFYRYTVYENHPSLYRFGSEESGMGFAAVLSEDRYSVIIKRPYLYTFDYGQTIIHDVDDEEVSLQLYEQFGASLVQEEQLYTYVPVISTYGTITIYNDETKEILYQIETPYTGNSIKTIQLILDAQYLLLTTKTHLTVIYNLESGLPVLEFTRFWLSEITYWEDTEDNRLFLMDINSLVCISMDDWVLLTTIGNVEQFDPETKTIYQIVSSHYPQNDLVYYQLPTTEELLDLAREFLGE